MNTVFFTGANKNTGKKKLLIIYDIADNRRRYKYSRYLEKYGRRVQKSAFEIEVDKQTYRKLANDTSMIIKKEDSVRIYEMGNDYGVVCYDETSPFWSPSLIFC